ncbi:hypothetical protein PY95_06295 [Lacticaseibacillus rhamnosus]|nr:hypothetical protein PY95_06295 [Lacticaseibacillus rhamnosus]OAU02334.1 hypothetical protein PY72_06295 [Lacticaseibacillus rhamnosus]
MHIKIIAEKVHNVSPVMNKLIKALYGPANRQVFKKQYAKGRILRTGFRVRKKEIQVCDSLMAILLCFVDVNDVILD